MARHPRIATVGELKASALGDVEHYRCSCGELLLQCPFWKRLGRELARRGVRFDPAHFGTHFRRPGRAFTDVLLRAGVRGPLCERLRDAGFALWPPARAARDSILAANKAFIESALEASGGDVFLDGSKDAVRMRHFLRAGIWDIRILYIIRDGRGCVNSYCRHTGSSVESAAREWRISHAECRRLLKSVPRDRWVRIRYEDLCADTTGELKRVYRFLDLDPAEAVDTYEPSRYHILGNNMRLSPLTAVTTDEKWRRAMSADALERFETRVGALNRSLGYA
jgi:hypothetical protein